MAAWSWAAVLVLAGCLSGCSGDDDTDERAFCEALAADLVADEADVRVFVEPGTSDEVVSALLDDIESRPDVVSSRVVDQEEAYEEFVERFSDSPEMLASVSPETLPSSIEVTLEAADGEGGQVERLRSAIGGRPEVDQVAAGAADLSIGRLLLDRLRLLTTDLTFAAGAMVGTDDALDAAIDAAPGDHADDLRIVRDTVGQGDAAPADAAVGAARRLVAFYDTTCAG